MLMAQGGLLTALEEVRFGFLFNGNSCVNNVCVTNSYSIYFFFSLRSSRLLEIRFGRLWLRERR